MAMDLCRSSEITGQLMTGTSAESLPINSVQGQRSATHRRFKLQGSSKAQLSILWGYTTGHLASCVTLELDAPYYNRDSCAIFCIHYL